MTVNHYNKTGGEGTKVHLMPDDKLIRKLQQGRYIFG